MDLPPEPGLNRRLAYSNIIRTRNINRNIINRTFNGIVNGRNILNSYQYCKKGLSLNELLQNSSVLLNSSFDCPICQEENNFDVTIIRKLNCNHQFHIYCIEKWLSMETTCPVCRKNLSNL